MVDTVKSVLLAGALGVMLAVAGQAQSPSQGTRARLIVDVMSFAGKTPSEVEAVLGDTLGSVKEGSYTRFTYRAGGPDVFPPPAGAVEIVFRDGEADWITVYGDDPALGLQSVGLASESRPVWSNVAGKGYENVQGLHRVSVFPPPSGYIFVCVRTCP